MKLQSCTKSNPHKTGKAKCRWEKKYCPSMEPTHQAYGIACAKLLFQHFLPPIHKIHEQKDATSSNSRTSKKKRLLKE